MHEDFYTINKAFQAGALGYVIKREDTNLLLDAITMFGEGRRYISPYVSATTETEKGK
jgi:DNA-binding NarL/FixJ family response regulator